MAERDTVGDAASMRKSLDAMYTKLEKMSLSLHARDFWMHRAHRQQQQVLKDPLMHEYTALKQYMSWHSPRGIRLPAFLRDSPHCVARV